MTLTLTSVRVPDPSREGALTKMMHPPPPPPSRVGGWGFQQYFTHAWTLPPIVVVLHARVAGPKRHRTRRTAIKPWPDMVSAPQKCGPRGRRCCIPHARTGTMYLLACWIDEAVDTGAASRLLIGVPDRGVQNALRAGKTICRLDPLGRGYRGEQGGCGGLWVWLGLFRVDAAQRTHAPRRLHWDRVGP